MLGIDEGYRRTRTDGVALERPPSLRLLRLTGPQREWFLQNTITADVEGAGEGRWVESCFLDPKGRVQAHFRTGFLTEEIWLDVAPDAAERLAEWFVRYRFRTKVEIETVARRCVTVAGPAAEALARDGRIETGEDGALIFGYRLAEVPAADVHFAADDAPGVSVERADPSLYEVLRVEAGAGAYGVDFTDRDLPQEAGLTRAVSVTKGCYVGQETIARIHFRGHINRVLRTLDFDAPSASGLAGLELRYEGAPVGRVTSTADSPARGGVGIGMVRVEPPAGAELDVEDGGRAVLGEVPEGTKVKT